MEEHATLMYEEGSLRREERLEMLEQQARTVKVDGR